MLGCPAAEKCEQLFCISELSRRGYFALVWPLPFPPASKQNSEHERSEPTNDSRGGWKSEEEMVPARRFELLTPRV